MDVNLLILALLAVGAAFAQGFCGFGYGILSMAGLSLMAVDLERASVYVTLTVLALVTTVLIRSRKDMKVDWRQAGLLFLGMLVGSPIGYWFILTCGEMPTFRLVFGVALIVFAINGLAKPHLKRDLPEWLAPVFGLFGGLLSGAFSSGGPPTVLYLYAQEHDPRMAVSSLQTVFLGAGLYRLLNVFVTGPGVGGRLWLESAVAAPVVVAGAAGGYCVARRVSSKGFLAGVYALIVLAGLINIGKAVNALWLA